MPPSSSACLIELRMILSGVRRPVSKSRTVFSEGAVQHRKDDVQVLEAGKTGGGLGISFNGDINAIKAAEVCLIADNAWPIALIASVFVLWGKEGIMEIATKGQAGASRYLVLPEAVIDYLMQGLKGRNFNLYASNARDPETTAQESMAMQAKLRGAALAGGTD